ncbi:uncharacterized protein LOC144344629 [Saccoglossus kowalevskii]
MNVQNNTDRQVPNLTVDQLVYNITSQHANESVTTGQSHRHISTSMKLPVTDNKGVCKSLNKELRDIYNTSDAGRKPLPNFYLSCNESAHSQYRAANVIFTHLPKVGGTSVEKILLQITPKEGVLRKSSVAHCSQLYKECVNSRNDSSQTVYYSKRTYGIHDYVFKYRPVAYVTWFREPIAKLVSSYYYLQKTHCGHAHPICKKFLQRTSSLTDFLKRSKRVHLQDMSNNMVRLLQFGDNPTIDDTFEDGHGAVHLSEAYEIPDVEEKHYLVAKRNIETNMAFIGLTEDFKTSQEMLSHIFGISQQNDTVHINANAHTEILTEYELNELRTRNKWDLKLYEDAKKIYQEQKENYFKTKKQTLV